jgi:hypothetical protein
LPGIRLKIRLHRRGICNSFLVALPTSGEYMRNGMPPLFAALSVVDG